MTMERASLAWSARTPLLRLNLPIESRQLTLENRTSLSANPSLDDFAMRAEYYHIGGLSVAVEIKELLNVLQICSGYQGSVNDSCRVGADTEERLGRRIDVAGAPRVLNVVGPRCL